MEIKGRFCSSDIQQAYLKLSACGWQSALHPQGEPDGGHERQDALRAVGSMAGELVMDLVPLRDSIALCQFHPPSAAVS